MTAFCCGAGGAQLFQDKPLRINTIRIKELKDTGAQHIAVECPHCLTMLTAASSDKEIPIEDIAEIVADAMQETGEPNNAKA